MGEFLKKSKREGPSFSGYGIEVGSVDRFQCVLSKVREFDF